MSSDKQIGQAVAVDVARRRDPQARTSRYLEAVDGKPAAHELRNGSLNDKGHCEVWSVGGAVFARDREFDNGTCIVRDGDVDGEEQYLEPFHVTEVPIGAWLYIASAKFLVCAGDWPV